MPTSQSIMKLATSKRDRINRNMTRVMEAFFMPTRCTSSFHSLSSLHLPTIHYQSVTCQFNEHTGTSPAGAGVMPVFSPQGAVHKLYNARWVEVGSRLRYIRYIGVGGGWIVRYITQGNYKWFIVHDAHFILTPSVVLKTAIITYSITFAVCSGAALCLQIMV